MMGRRTARLSSRRHGLRQCGPVPMDAVQVGLPVEAALHCGAGDAYAATGAVTQQVVGHVGGDERLMTLDGELEFTIDVLRGKTDAWMDPHLVQHAQDGGHRLDGFGEARDGDVARAFLGQDVCQRLHDGFGGELWPQDARCRIGFPYGDTLGLCRMASSRVATSSEITCSHRQASSCTRSSGSPIT